MASDEERAELEALTIPELTDLAADRNVDIAGRRLKGDIIDALVAAGETQPMELHYVGDEDDDRYVPGIPTDPHATVRAGADQAAGLIETGLYAEGPAPERPEEPAPEQDGAASAESDSAGTPADGEGGPA